MRLLIFLYIFLLSAGTVLSAAEELVLFQETIRNRRVDGDCVVAADTTFGSGEFDKSEGCLVTRSC